MLSRACLLFYRKVFRHLVYTVMIYNNITFLKETFLQEHDAEKCPKIKHMVLS